MPRRVSTVGEVGLRRLDRPCRPDRHGGCGGTPPGRCPPPRRRCRASGRRSRTAAAGALRRALRFHAAPDEIAAAPVTARRCHSATRRLVSSTKANEGAIHEDLRCRRNRRTRQAARPAARRERPRRRRRRPGRRRSSTASARRARGRSCFDVLDAGRSAGPSSEAAPDVVVHEATALAGLKGIRKHFDEAFARRTAADSRHGPPARGGAGDGRDAVRRPELRGLAVRAGRAGRQGRGRAARPVAAGERLRGRWPRSVTSRRRRRRRRGSRASRCATAASTARHGAGRRRRYARAGPPARIPARRRRRAGSGRSSTSTTPPRRRSPPSSAAAPASTTSSTTSRPRREWLPDLAEVLGAKPPRHVPAWLGGRLAARRRGRR